jgi:hypothetical protein
MDKGQGSAYVVRLQAQGGGLEESAVLTGDKPITVAQGVEGLEALKGRLTRRQLAERAEPIRRAERFIHNGLLEAELLPQRNRSRCREAIFALMVRSCEASTSENEATTMVRRLFEAFLDSESEYRSCEGYWEALVSGIAESMGQRHEWRRWIPRQHPNGTAMELDGNPIFDGRSDRLGRAFRIIQHSATGAEVEIAAWVKSYEPEYADLPGHELVLNLSLSEESAGLVRTLLRRWMAPDAVFEELDEFVRAVMSGKGPDSVQR